MAHSIGLTLYNLTSRVAGNGGPKDWPPRPEGRLVWIHIPSPDLLAPLLNLAQKQRGRGGEQILLTAGFPLPPVAGMTTLAPPSDAPGPVRAFLDHWRPDLLLTAEGDLRPSLFHELAERGLPLLIVEARQPQLPKGREALWPGLLRATLAEVTTVLALDETSARAFRRAGALDVRVSGRLEHPSAALPCTEAERAHLAALLTARPVWFVPALPEEEEEIVIAAHRLALRLAHRLLLIVAPLDPSRAAPLAERMETGEGWLVARRSAEEEPETEVQALIADGCTEMGLWYRLAPVSYLAGSLTSQGCLRDPFEAAALGSAILHGPRAGAFGTAIGRLAAAQATNLVAHPADLSQVLGEVLAPDRAARRAQAAWAVASDGGAATDLALSLIREGLERRA